MLLYYGKCYSNGVSPLWKSGDKSDFGWGVFLGVVSLFLLFQLSRLGLSSGIDSYITGMTGVKHVMSWVTIVTAGLIYLTLARYFYYKHSPYMGYGFLVAIFVPVLFSFMLLIEIMIHPPDEE